MCVHARGCKTKIIKGFSIKTPKEVEMMFLQYKQSQTNKAQTPQQPSDLLKFLT